MPDPAIRPLRILIIDDHPVVVAGCRSMFAAEPNVELTSAENEKHGHQAYLDQRPDVTIIDINLPDLSGFELLRRIRKDDPSARIVIFSMNDEPAFVVRAIELGAMGYVSKSDNPQLLVDAVRAVATGNNFIPAPLAQAVTFSSAAVRANPASQLTPRELEILRLLSRGSKIVEIAEALEISYKTVANTTSLLKQKLGARSHSDLIRVAVEIGLN